MTQPSYNSIEQKEVAINRILLICGLLPFIFSLVIGSVVGHPGFVVAPLFGFCPLDICRVASSPSLQQLSIWVWSSAAICVVFAIFAFFKPPLGGAFALVMWLSTIVLFWRVGAAMEHIVF